MVKSKCTPDHHTPICFFSYYTFSLELKMQDRRDTPTVTTDSCHKHFCKETRIRNGRLLFKIILLACTFGVEHQMLKRSVEFPPVFVNARDLAIKTEVLFSLRRKEHVVSYARFLSVCWISWASHLSICISCLVGEEWRKVIKAMEKWGMKDSEGQTEMRDQTSGVWETCQNTHEPSQTLL